MGSCLVDVVKSAVSLFAIVDPIGNVPVFISLMEERDESEIRSIAKRASITVLFALSTASLVGKSILKVFGITMPSFQIGGGILLIFISLDMLHAKVSRVKHSSEERGEVFEKEDIGVVPLGIPLLAGPGAMTQAIILYQASSSLVYRVGFFISIVIISILVYFIVKGSVTLKRFLGGVGINIVKRLMGLLLMAVAVEFVIEGIKGAFPGLSIIGR